MVLRGKQLYLTLISDAGVGIRTTLNSHNESNDKCDVKDEHNAITTLCSPGWFHNVGNGQRRTMGTSVQASRNAAAL